MAKPAALALLLVLGSAPALAAQSEYYVRLGATGASTLLRDEIVSPITTRQSIAPTLVVGASVALAPRYGVGLEAALASGGYHATERGVETGLGTLRTASVLLNLSAPLVGPLRWRAGLGTISYLPADKRGIFLSGGRTTWLAGAGLDYRRPLLRRLDLLASARYDFHRFTTDELRARGFAQSQQISRVSLTVGLAGGNR